MGPITTIADTTATTMILTSKIIAVTMIAILVAG
jgi:hypothetical protein